LRAALPDRGSAESVKAADLNFFQRKAQHENDTFRTALGAQFQRSDFSVASGYVFYARSGAFGATAAVH
jgi:hypothetical protein